MFPDRRAGTCRAANAPCPLEHHRLVQATKLTREPVFPAFSIPRGQRSVSQHLSPGVEKILGRLCVKDDFHSAIAAVGAVLAGQSAAVALNEPGGPGAGSKHRFESPQPSLIRLEQPVDSRFENYAREGQLR